jgi:diguanylate cyclase (GGDEF)-like protein/PAS domain S-box-containing protein
MDAVDAGVAVHGPDGRLLRANRRMRELTGGGDRWWGATGDAVAAGLRRALDGGDDGPTDHVLPAADGGTFHATVCWRAARDAAGAVVAAVATVRDVTERLLMEEAWEEAARVHRLLAETSTDVIVRVSSSVRLLYVSPSVSRVLGHEPGDLAGRRLLDLVHPGDRAGLLRRWRELADGADDAVVTFRAPHADGRWVWLEAVAHVMRDDDGRLLEIQASARDVGARREAEERSRRMAEELGFVARHAGDMISSHDADGAFRTVSDACRPLLGREPDEIIGTSPLRLAHPDDRAHLAAALGRVRTGRALVETVTYRAVTADGGVVWLDTSIRAALDDDGGVTAMIWVSRDATARLAAEREAGERAERSRLEADEQGALRRVAMAVANQSDAPPVLAMVAGEVPRLLGVDGGLVVRFTGPGAARVEAASGEQPWVAGDEITLPDGSALALLRTSGRTSRASTPLGVGGALEVASTVAAPVRVEDGLWGAVAAVGRRGGVVPAGAEARLARFAELVSAAVTAAESRAVLAAQALTDPLTGLANHRAFHERLRAEVTRARRYGRPLSLAILDIDHFKRLNDLHGHQTGDAVLAGLAGVLTRTARSTEMVARVGGEEFGWILPETTAEDAVDAVERARAGVARARLLGDDGVTISGGVCDLTDAGDADEVFRLADAALYFAKANGRDMVCRYRPEVVDTLSGEERVEHLERARILTALRSLVLAVDARDGATAAHSERVAGLAHGLALALGWAPGRATRLREAALLHDVGKLGVPDAILLKPGPLSPEEQAVVRRHPALGAEIGADALTAEQCGWIRHHHERWDGAGYPDGLAGEQIPEGARVIAVAEAWDAMTTTTAYRAARTPEGALEELRRCAGSRYWPPAAAAMARLAAEGAAAAG